MIRKKNVQVLKKSKGITLIALVITIIVLLILAGVTLSFVAGENGILKRAESAVKVNEEAVAKEEINLAISEKIIDYYETNRSKTLLEYLNENLKNYETPSGAIIDCKDSVINYNGSQMATIGENGKVTFDKGTGLEIVYNASAINENNINLIIIITAKADKIKQIEMPDGSVEDGNGREKVELTYTVEFGKEYKIKVISEGGIEKEEILNFRRPKEPVIPEINLSYPVVTLTGLESPRQKIEIEYEESGDFLNYYSLDDGKTWNKYTGAITVKTGTKNVKAKSEYKKCAQIYSESVSLVNQGTMADALTEDAYNDNLESYTHYENTGHNYGAAEIKFLVDESTWWNGLKVNYKIWNTSGYWRQLGCVFLDENGNEIDKMAYRSLGTAIQNEVDELRIPEKTRSIVLYTDLYVDLFAVSVFEVQETEEFWPIFERNIADGINVEVDCMDANTPAYFACDSALNTAWTPLSGDYNPHWFKITFKNPRVVNKYYFQGVYCWGVLPKFYMQASHDGTNWINLEGDTVHEGSPSAPVEFNVELQNSTAYKYYRFYFPEGGWTYGSSGGAFIYNLKLFGTK